MTNKQISQQDPMNPEAEKAEKSEFNLPLALLAVLTLVALVSVFGGTLAPVAAALQTKFMFVATGCAGLQWASDFFVGLVDRAKALVKHIKDPTK